MLCASMALQGIAADAAPVTCTARSTAKPPQVVELYTSEGCSSCPPADAWLATLKGRTDVIALGFHVHYWDRLGWPDRFASEAYTKRQYGWAARLGSSNVYTPQVLVDGQDWRGWPRLPLPAVPAAAAPPPQVTLTRQADGQVQARVEPLANTASSQLRWGAYWAVVEDGHVSRVRAGENAGETLRHDHVVRLHQTLPAFAAHEGLTSRLDVPPGAASNPRRVVFVVTSVPGEHTLQALTLGC
jgi:hypothetical protein